MKKQLNTTYPVRMTETERRLQQLAPWLMEAFVTASQSSDPEDIKTKISDIGITLKSHPEINPKVQEAFFGLVSHTLPPEVAYELWEHTLPSIREKHPIEAIFETAKQLGWLEPINEDSGYDKIGWIEIGKGEDAEIAFTTASMLDYFTLHGVGNFYDTTLDKYLSFYVKDNVATVFSKTHEKRFIKNFILNEIEAEMESTEDPKFQEILSKARTEYLNRGSRAIDDDFLKTQPIRFLNDTLTDTYIPFSNGVVHITKDVIELLPLNDPSLNGAIDSDEIDHTATSVSEIKFLEDEEVDGSEIARFYQKIGANYLTLERDEKDRPTTETVDEKTREAKMRSLRWLTGQLLNKHHRRFAVLLLDQSDEIHYQSKGRRGKGALVTGISALRRTFDKNGKMFSNIGQFPFSGMFRGASIIHFEDVKEDFDYKLLFNGISDKMEVNEKNEKVRILYDERPKTVISSNHFSPAMDETSIAARFYAYEFPQYFTADFGLDQFLGHELFSWKKDDPEWQRTFNYYFKCIKFYHQNDHIDPVLTTSKTHSIAKAVGVGLAEWFNFEYWKSRSVESMQVKGSYGISFTDFEFNYNCNAGDTKKIKKATLIPAIRRLVEINKGWHLNVYQHANVDYYRIEDFKKPTKEDKTKEEIEKLTSNISTGGSNGNF